MESQLPGVFPKLGAESNTQIILLSITCGTSDILIGINRQFHAYLESKSVKHTFTEVPDQGHVWPLWSQNLADFAPLLFR